MSTAQQIANAIIEHVNSMPLPNFTVWHIGLTHDYNERYEYWGRPEHWKCWEANSLSDAQKVESYFINKMDMQGGTGGELDHRKVTYVYIF